MFSQTMIWAIWFPSFCLLLGFLAWASVSEIFKPDVAGDRRLGWKPLKKQTFRIILRKPEDKVEFGLNIRFDVDCKMISLKRVLLTGFALDLPRGTTAEQFLAFLGTVEYRQHDMYRLLSAFNDQSLLDTVGFKEADKECFQRLKEKFMKDAFQQIV